MTNKTADRINRRTFLATSVVAGAMTAMSEPLVAQTKGKKTFTILHTNDLHSNLIGMAPASDFTPVTLNDDNTRGGFARLATKIAERKVATAGLGPVLILDAGDFSMGTAFAAATRETGAELRLLAMLGCDATTLGNHDFTLGPDGTAAAIGAAVEAGQVPVVLATNTDFSAPAPTLTGLQRLGAQGRIRSYLVIERGGIRFGIFGVLGREAAIYSVNAAPPPLPIRWRRLARRWRCCAIPKKSMWSSRSAMAGCARTRTEPLPKERMSSLPPKCPG